LIIRVVKNIITE